MESIYLDATKSSPEVDFDAEKGVLSIKGRSFPERTADFYRPLIDWTDKYIQSPKSATTFNMYLSFMNCGSDRCILVLLKKLEDIYCKGSKVNVNWYVDKNDEDMMDIAKELKATVKIPFELVHKLPN